MHSHPCGSRCAAGCQLSRRGFLAGTSAVLGAVLAGCAGPGAGPGAGAPGGAASIRRVKAMGPGSRCVPRVRACFVRRKGEYGMLWPGAVYDGAGALRQYTEQLEAAARELRIKLELRAEPVYSAAEADAWVGEAAAAKPDGLLVVVLDRQAHAWPTAAKAMATELPTVVFSPIGTSFTTNTAGLAAKPGSVILSTDDFEEVRYGLRMLGAGPRIRASRCLVIAGNQTVDREVAGVGMKLHYVPARTFLDLYQETAETEEIRALAAELERHATARRGASGQDVLNGIKSYVVARTLLEREEADAISMDCLGALGKTKVSLPCIAWSKMNDDGVPAACEADVGAIATHALVQELFGRPGFQVDPVGDTGTETVIGAHCSCPTRLNGFGAAPEPYDLVHHHGERDATARTKWRAGQKVTMADVLPGTPGVAGKPTQVLIAAGAVVDNVAVPPAGGCVISVRVKFDSRGDVLAFPGFHQVFFYGDYRRQLAAYCKLQRLEAVMV